MAINTNITTVTLASGETSEVQFNRNYERFFIRNDSGSDVYFSLNSNVTADADGVYKVPSGDSCGTAGNYPADTVYIIGTGKVQVAAVQDGVNPFKVGPKGGVTETDPTVPAWAKQPSKPGYNIGGTNLIPYPTYDLSRWGIFNTNTSNTVLSELMNIGMWKNICSKKMVRTSTDGALNLFLNEIITGNPLKAGKYVLSIYYYTNDNTLSLRWGNYYVKSDSTEAYPICDNNSLTIGNWTKWTYYFELPEDVTRLDLRCYAFGTGTIYLALPKLEYGEIATDWSPSPYDLPLSMQTGKVTTTNGTATVTFARAFSAAPAVTATAVGTGVYTSVADVSATGFTVNTSTNTANVINWLATEV